MMTAISGCDSLTWASSVNPLSPGIVTSHSIKANSPLARSCRASAGLAAVEHVYPARSRSRATDRRIGSSSSTTRMWASAPARGNVTVEFIATTRSASIGAKSLIARERCFVRQREQHGDGGPDASRGCDRGPSSGSIGDAVDHGESQAGAPTRLLRREKRLERFGGHFGGHALSVVAYLNTGKGTGAKT